VSLGQKKSGTDPIIYVETVKQAEMEQRLEFPPSNGFVADPSQDLSLIQDERRGDKSEVDQRLEPLQDKDYLSQQNSWDVCHFHLGRLTITY
jgi:hypothetical protein